MGLGVRLDRSGESRHHRRSKPRTLQPLANIYETTIIIIIIIIIIKTVKVNFTLEQATKAQRGSRVIALLFL